MDLRPILRCAILDENKFIELLRLYGEVFIAQFEVLPPERKQAILSDNRKFIRFFDRASKVFRRILEDVLGTEYVFVYMKDRRKWILPVSLHGFYSYVKRVGLLSEWKRKMLEYV